MTNATDRIYRPPGCALSVNNAKSPLSPPRPAPNLQAKGAHAQPRTPICSKSAAARLKACPTPSPGRGAAAEAMMRLVKGISSPCRPTNPTNTSSGSRSPLPMLRNLTNRHREVLGSAGLVRAEVNGQRSLSLTVRNEPPAVHRPKALRKRTAAALSKPGTTAKTEPIACKQKTEKKTDLYSRKDKSLGLLCEKFLDHYGQPNSQEISLDCAAKRLGVERRRIYDIVNILESVNIVSKKGKNRYTWHGFENLQHALEELKVRLDIQFGSVKRPDSVTLQPRIAQAKGYLGSDSGSLEQQRDQESLTSSSRAKKAPSKDKGEKEKEQSQSGLIARRDKSLARLSQKFVQLFLQERENQNNPIISLENAAVSLLPDGADQVVDEKQHKTKVRRLYDIANVLASIHLIEKVHLPNSRKPAFRWVYPMRRQACSALSSSKLEFLASASNAPDPDVNLETSERTGGDPSVTENTYPDASKDGASDQKRDFHSEVWPSKQGVKRVTSNVRLGDFSPFVEGDPETPDQCTTRIIDKIFTPPVATLPLGSAVRAGQLNWFPWKMNSGDLLDKQTSRPMAPRLMKSILESRVSEYMEEYTAYYEKWSSGGGRSDTLTPMTSAAMARLTHLSEPGASPSVRVSSRTSHHRAAISRSLPTLIYKSKRKAHSGGKGIDDSPSTDRYQPCNMQEEPQNSSRMRSWSHTLPFSKN